MRFSKTHFRNGKADLTCFVFPDQSVNRSWKGAPEDCLIPTNPVTPIDAYKTWGIISLQVANTAVSFSFGATFTKPLPNEGPGLEIISCLAVF